MHAVQVRSSPVPPTTTASQEVCELLARLCDAGAPRRHRHGSRPLGARSPAAHASRSDAGAAQGPGRALAHLAWHALARLAAWPQWLPTVRCAPCPFLRP